MPVRAVFDDDVKRPTLLVGSFPYKSARETLTVSAKRLSGVAARLTDGEAQGWNTFPGRLIPQVVGLEPDDDVLLLPNRQVQRYRIEPGRSAKAIKFSPAGYAPLVEQSFATFRELKEEGKIAPGIRFQQSLPTPFGVLGMYMRKEDIGPLLPEFEATTFGEVTDVFNSVPARETAIQWDVAVEVVSAIEGHTPGLIDLFPMDTLAETVARAADTIPGEAELGLHFCYGNPGGKHVIEPRDLGNLVAFCNAIVPKLQRVLTWVHMPVPISRDDDAYFQALEDLRLPAGAEFYLGLIHLADGLEGAKRRIAAACKYRSEFGVGTECGFRYVPVDQVPALLDLHRQLAFVV